MDTFTSLLAGFTTFSVLGNLAYQSGVDVKDVVKPGPGIIDEYLVFYNANYRW